MLENPLFSVHCLLQGGSCMEEQSDGAGDGVELE